MPTPIDPKRLPRLRAALEQFAEDEKASQHALADIYGVTNARMTTLIKQRFEDFPSPERRDDKTHWFPARPAITSMITYLEGAGKKKREAAQRAAAVMGHATEAAAAAPDDEEPPPMGPVELDRMASAATRIWRLAVDQKKYVLASNVRQWARSLFETVKREVSAIPHTIDPNGELPPLHRARLESHCRDTLIKLHDSLDELLSNADQGTG